MPRPWPTADKESGNEEHEDRSSGYVAHVRICLVPLRSAHHLRRSQRGSHDHRNQERPLRLGGMAAQLRLLLRPEPPGVLRYELALRRHLGRHRPVRPHRRARRLLRPSPQAARQRHHRQAAPRRRQQRVRRPALAAHREGDLPHARPQGGGHRQARRVEGRAVLRRVRQEGHPRHRRRAHAHPRPHPRRQDAPRALEADRDARHDGRIVLRVRPEGRAFRLHVALRRRARVRCEPPGPAQPRAGQPHQRARPRHQRLHGRGRQGADHDAVQVFRQVQEGAQGDQRRQQGQDRRAPEEDRRDRRRHHRPPGGC